MLHHYLGVDHHYAESVLAGRDIEGHIEPTKIVEHLVTTRQTLALIPTAEQKSVGSGQRFQHLGHGEILRGVFSEGIHNPLSGIDNLHRLIVNLHTETQSTFGTDVLSGQDAYGNHIRLQVDVVFECSTIARDVGSCNYIVATHASLATSEVGQENPFRILSVHLIIIFICRDGIF